MKRKLVILSILIVLTAVSFFIWLYLHNSGKQGTSLWLDEFDDVMQTELDLSKYKSTFIQHENRTVRQKGYTKPLADVNATLANEEYVLAAGFYECYCMPDEVHHKTYNKEFRVEHDESQLSKDWLDLLYQHAPTSDALLRFSILYDIFSYTNDIEVAWFNAITEYKSYRESYVRANGVFYKIIFVTTDTTQDGYIDVYWGEQYDPAEYEANEQEN